MRAWGCVLQLIVLMVAISPLNPRRLPTRCFNQAPLCITYVASGNGSSVSDTLKTRYDDAWNTECTYTYLIASSQHHTHHGCHQHPTVRSTAQWQRVHVPLIPAAVYLPPIKSTTTFLYLLHGQELPPAQQEPEAVRWLCRQPHGVQCLQTTVT
jgi:hypothetical protein